MSNKDNNSDNGDGGDAFDDSPLNETVGAESEKMLQDSDDSNDE